MEKNRKNSKIEKIDDKNEEKWKIKWRKNEKNRKIERENTKLKKSKKMKKIFFWYFFDDFL